MALTALLVALLCAVSGGQALAQSDSRPPPTDLWNEYPLESESGSDRSQGEGGGGNSAPSREAPERTAGEEGGSSGLLVPLGAGAALLILLGAGLVARRTLLRRRRKRELGERLAAAGRSGPSPRPALVLQPRPAIEDEQEPPVEDEVPLDEGSGRPVRPRIRLAGDDEAVVETNGQPSAAAGAVDSSLEDHGPIPAAEDVPAEPGDDDGELMPPVPAGRADKAPREGERERAIGYSSVERGAGPNAESGAQAEAIEAACERLGLDFLELVHDTEPKSGSDLKRPGLMYALERISLGEASCMIVPGIDRLARSAGDLGSLMEWFGENNVRLVALDIGLDTATPDGQLAARALAAVGGLERQRLGERTRKGLEAARTKRRSSGRPAVSDRPALKQRIADMRAEGMTLQAIADTLNAEGVPTLRGGSQWRPSSVQAAAGYKRPSRKNELTGLRGPGSSDGAEDGSTEPSEVP